MEVLVEDADNREQTLAALEASAEQEWLKTALTAVLVLRQPFAVKVDHENEADQLAARIRSLGFKCRVWSGASPSQRVDAKD